MLFFKGFLLSAAIIEMLIWRGLVAEIFPFQHFDRLPFAKNTSLLGVTKALLISCCG